MWLAGVSLPTLRQLPGLVVAGAIYCLLALGTGYYFTSIGVPIAVIRPGTGFALGLLLVKGLPYWPALFVGSLAARLVLGYSFLGSLTISLGVALGAALGVRLLNRDTIFDASFSSFHDFFRLIFWAGVIGVSVSTLTGTVALWQDDITSAQTFLRDMLRWWMGDVLGILLVTPFLLVWQKPPKDWLSSGPLLELVAYFGTAFMAGQMIFLEWRSEFIGKVALGYWMFLFVTWGAARLGAHSVVIVLLMTTLQALYGASAGVGFFATDIARTGLSNVWFYLLVLSTVGMGLASAVNAFRKAEAETRELALHDSLTGLANRRLLTDRAQRAIAAARRDGKRVGLILHDLDDFKSVNDLYGHHAGDGLLQDVAARVLGSVREADTVGRIGGDEFLIILPRVETLDDVVKVAEQIQAALGEPFQVDGDVIRVSTSIGIAVYPEHGTTEALLTVRADSAMYAAKQGGRNRIRMYTGTEPGAGEGIREAMHGTMRHPLR